MKRCSSYLAICMLVFCLAVQATEVVWQYPCELTHVSTPKCDCWTGIDENGNFGLHVYVNPEQYLIDAPPSEKSAVTIITDHWIEIGFAGELTDGPGPDLIIREMGRMGETALVLLSDGRSKTYALGIATADYDMSQQSTLCEFDLKDVQPGFSPTAVRIMSLGLGGGSPGFDVGSVKARITVQSPPPYLPLPGHKATDVQPDESLSWTGSGQASAVHLYLGQNLSAVNPEESIPFASLPGDVNVFVPDIPWELGQTYYWRIVEIVSSSQSPANTGEIWQFKVNPHRIINEFGQYTDSSFISDWWATHAVASLAHCEESTYEGCNAAKFEYHLAGFDYAQVMYVKDGGRGEMTWNQPGATTLEFYFRSLPGNSEIPNLYVQVDDLKWQHMIVMYTGDPNHLSDGLWHPWRIDLTEFDNLELNRIASMTIGVQFSDPDNTPATGTLFIDQIQLCGPRHPSDLTLKTDLTQDQEVTPADLALFANAWLSTDQEVLAVQEPNAPWCFMPFNHNTSDIQGHAQTIASGSLGIENQYVEFKTPEARIQILNARQLTQFTRGITLSFWQNGDSSIHRTDTLVCADFAYPERAPELAIGLGLWEHPEALFWQCGHRQDPNNVLAGIHQVSEQWSQRWNHWAFTKDFVTGRMVVYLNGTRLYQGRGQTGGLTDLNTLDLGNGWYGYYDGLMDDFRIHNYALKDEECAYLATKGTGMIPQPAIMPSDFNQDGRVDWQDFAILASEWMYSI